MIEQMREQYSVRELCDGLGVSRSGYYSWKSSGCGARAEANKLLVDKIRAVHAHRYKKYYGSPRMTAELKACGYRCSRNRVARLMCRHGLSAPQRRSFRPRTTHSDKKATVAPNRLGEQPPLQRPGQQLVSDITYIRSTEGWLYLTIVEDLYSRAILGWNLSDRLSADSVIKAIDKANNSGWIQPNALFHSDRGCQYTSHQVRELLSSPRFQQSMSAKGYCYDNAFAESCFASIKAEMLPESQIFNSKLQARRAVFDYIETFYNRTRRHSSIGQIAPFQFLELYLQSQRKYSN